MAGLRQLTKQDVLFVAGETAKVYQHTGGLVLLDASGRQDFNFKSFRAHVEQRISQIPHFHWKLHEVPLGLDLPYWVEDENFSFDHHIKRIAVPSPGDREALGEVVAHLYSKHLDRSRPLWEMWFIEGLADGRCAILQKLHHCMMDGQGASKLGEIMSDFEPDAPPREIEHSITEARAGEVPSQWQRSSNAALNLARFPAEASREIFGMVRPRLWQQLTGKKKEAKQKPVVPQAFFNGDIGSERGFVFGSVPLSDIKMIKNSLEVSINDVVLALVGSSMRAYMLAQGDLPAEPLRTGIAISLRTEADDEFSNKVTNASVTLATHLEDPLKRLRAIHEETEQAKREARGGAKGMMEVMQMMPPLLVSTLVGAMPADSASQLMGSNLIVSNVRGIDEAMYIAGARMETMYPMSIITPGIGINFTCVSYAGKVDFGVTIEPELVPDAWFIIDELHVALQEYLALAGKRSRPGRNAPAGKKATARKKAVPIKKAAAKRTPAPKKKATPKRKSPARKA